MSNEIAPRERGDLAPLDPLTMVSQALDRGVDAASLEQLVNLANAQQDRQNAKEYALGLKEFQDTCPPIPKSSVAEIASNRGAKYSYNYAKLEDIDRIVRPLLHRLGFSFGWDSAVSDAGILRVTCTLRHENGHATTSTFAVPTDSQNPGMSGPQKFASAETFARRYSLTAILGLTTVDPDSDGQDLTPLNEPQAATIHEMLDAWCDAKGHDRPDQEAKLLRHLRADSVEEIRASRYAEAVSVLTLRGPA